MKTAAALDYPSLMSKLPSFVPAYIKDLILRCLAVDPRKRPTAKAILDELESLIALPITPAAEPVEDALRAIL